MYLELAARSATWSPRSNPAPRRPRPRPSTRQASWPYVQISTPSSPTATSAGRPPCAQRPSTTDLRVSNSPSSRPTTSPRSTITTPPYVVNLQRKEEWHIFGCQVFLGGLLITLEVVYGIL